MNRRLAEHRGRKSGPQFDGEISEQASSNPNRKAQEAAARVAARYAKAPSYSEMLANEARAALRAAEAASEAALQAKAAAESVLANIEAASMPVLGPSLVSEPVDTDLISDQFSTESELSNESVEEQRQHSPEDTREQSLAVQWVADLPVSHGEFKEDSQRFQSAEHYDLGVDEIQMVDPAMPIHGNLLEFPRELVATRKVRPRLAESPYADADMQLSIFEVDPKLISTEPAADAVQSGKDEWTEPAWSGMQLGAQPFEDYYDEPAEEPAVRPQVRYHLSPASFERRINAALVDGTLIAGGLVGIAALVLKYTTSLPGVHAMEFICASSLLVIAAAYMTLFYAMAPCTPGMKLAGIRFYTFDGEIPTREQRWHRLGAMLLSVLPAGLGLAWSLFDDDNLSWHDRVSKTYICEC